MMINQQVQIMEEMDFQRKRSPKINFELRWKSHVTESLWSKELRSPINFTDMEFRCSDGSIKCHTSYLKTMCPIVNYLMADLCIEKGQGNVLIIPDYNISIVTLFLEMIYTGSTQVEGENDFEEMRQFGFKLLGFFMGLNMNVKLEKKINPLIETPKPTNKTPASKIIPDLPIDYTATAYSKSSDKVESEKLIKNDFFFFDETKLSDCRKRSKEMPSLNNSYSKKLKNTEFNNNDDSPSAEEPAAEEMLTEETISYDPDHSYLSPDSFNQAEKEVITSTRSDLNDDSLLDNLQQLEKPVKNREWECRICFEKLPTRNELTHHSLEIHDERQPFACTLCPKKYTTLGHLSAHQKVVHLKVLDVICEMCGKKFACKSEFTRHTKNLISCKNELKKRYSCPNCLKKFTSTEGLKRHNRLMLCRVSRTFS